MNVFTTDATLAEQFAEADREWREAITGVSAAFAEVAACEEALEEAAAKRTAAVRLKNEREARRGELSEKSRSRRKANDTACRFPV